MISERQRVWLVRVGVVAAVIVVAVAGRALVEYGRQSSSVGYVKAMRERDRLAAELERAEQRLEALQARAARLDSDQRVDQHATSAVRQRLARLQEENQQLREELQFYRNIVAPSKAGAGVRIQRFKIDQGEGERRYHYQLTLIRVQGVDSRRRGRARGVVAVTIEGTQDGKQKTVALRELVEPKGAELDYSIKYFKEFEGSLALPPGFVPKAAVARVVPRGETEHSAEQRIEWPTLADRGGEPDVGQEQ